MSRDVKEVVKMLTRDGWVKVSQNKHIKMRHEKLGMVIVPVSPRCPHWKKNLLKQIEHTYKAKGMVLAA